MRARTISIPRLVEQVVATLSQQFQDRGLTLTVDVPPDLPEVFGDPGRIIAARLPLQPGVPALLHNRPARGAPTAYVCRNFACDLPVTEVNGLPIQRQDFAGVDFQAFQVDHGAAVVGFPESRQAVQGCVHLGQPSARC